MSDGWVFVIGVIVIVALYVIFDVDHMDCMEIVCMAIFLMVVAIVGVWAWDVVSSIGIDWRWE